MKTGCYHSKEGDDLSVIVSQGWSHPHEFVHAIEIQALGLGHPTLMEGLAEYLGAPRMVRYGDSFPERFKAMIAKSPRPDDDYDLAMGFVGVISCLLQSGRHRLAIAFPSRPEARGEATLRLEYVGPPP